MIGIEIGKINLSCIQEAVVLVDNEDSIFIFIFIIFLSISLFGNDLREYPCLEFARKGERLERIAS